MTSLITKKRSKKAGLPPGALVHVGNIVNPKIHISMIDYDPAHLVERDDITAEECVQFLHTPSVTWINVRGIHDSSVLKTIGKHFDLHGLLLEDVMNATQRSKLDDYKSHIFIVMRMLTFREELDILEDEQISVILGPNYVISFLENTKDIFEPIRNRIRSGSTRIRSMGADYLCYAIIDSIVDNYFVVLEAVDKKLDDLEDTLMHAPKPTVMNKIQRAKREIILLRKSVWPMREVVNSFRRLETPLISSATQLYMHDVYDHTIQAIDTIESFRDIASGMLDVYLSNMSQRMNEIMKVLTIVSTIFVPLTFIASIYGMNFDHMPELRWQWGYYFTLGIMGTAALGMLIFFRRKHWI
ncbi:MAG: magnesium/cobalt transporter CorA [Parachlamydiaceae bacterium]|nr:magnesium/cobalt transporter CorA [Parachlamydiaceae bacterium]